MADRRDNEIAASLVEGGPFVRLQERLGIIRHDAGDLRRQVVVSLALTWIPLVLLRLFESPVGRTGMLQDLSVHVRLLVSVPCFFAGERMLDQLTRRCLARFVEGRWAAGQEGEIRRHVSRMVRARDSWIPEALLLAVTLAFGQAVYWGLVDESAFRPPWLRTQLASTFWYSLMSLSLFRFLALRWLWRWILWTALLVRLSRLEVRPIAIHPDELGGLSFLSEPSIGFSSVVLGSSAMLAADWSDRMIADGAGDLETIAVQALMLALGAAAIAFGPLLTFVPCLWRARLEALRSFGNISTDYVRSFQRRWWRQEEREREGLLGTPDIQSLADLAGAYDVLRKMRYVPITKRALLVVVLSALFPMSLLVFVEIPFRELARDIIVTLAGRLRG